MRRRTFLIGVPLLAARRAVAAPAPITALTYTPDGASVVCSGYREILVCSLRDGAVARRIPCDLAQIHDLAFSPDGAVLAAAGGTPGTSGAAQMLTWPEGKPLAVLARSQDLATSAGFSPDGSMLAVAGSDRTVQIWDAGKGPSTAPSLTLTGHAGPVLAVRYSPDGKLLVTTSADRSLRVWDARTGELQRALTNHTGIVHGVAFAPPIQGGSPHPYCASGSDDRTVRIWQPGIGRMVRIVRGHSGPVLSVLYNRDGTRLFAAGTEGIVRVIDAESDQVLKSWKASDQWIYRLALSPDGTVLAAGDWAGKLRFWRWASSG